MINVIIETPFNKSKQFQTNYIEYNSLDGIGAILENREPIIVCLKKSKLRYKQDNKIVYIEIESGILHFQSNNCKILVDDFN